MFREEAKKLLEQIYNNPKLALQLKLGEGCERIAYQLNEDYVVKIEKKAMFNEENYKENEKDTKISLYYLNLRDASYEGQFDREFELVDLLTEEESKVINPIVDVGEFNDGLYCISPKVTTGMELKCYSVEELCEKYDKTFDYEALNEFGEKHGLDIYDMTDNSGNFGINKDGDIVIIDYGLM